MRDLVLCSKQSLSIFVRDLSWIELTGVSGQDHCGAQLLEDASSREQS